jgi:hypothetical protein
VILQVLADTLFRGGDEAQADRVTDGAGQGAEGE